MQTISIGRDSSNSIVMNDTFISRKHASLVISDDGRVLIRDLGSSNGTFVNGNRIGESYLQPGDIVKCGAVLLNWQPYVLSSSFGNNRPESSTAKADSRNPGLNQAQHRQGFNADSHAVPAKEHNNIADPYDQIENRGHNQQPQTAALQMQQNVIIMGKAKSVGTAFLLAIFFGPLGLLYASVTGGVIMFILTIPILILTAFIGIFFINPICSIWAVIAANQANAALQNSAGGLINNNFQR